MVIYNDEENTTNDDFWQTGSTLQMNVDGAWVTIAAIDQGGGGTWVWNPHDDGYISITPNGTRTMSLNTPNNYWVSSGDQQNYVDFFVHLNASDIGKTIKFKITGTWEDGGSSGEETMVFEQTDDATSITAADATNCNETSLSWSIPSGLCAGAVAEIYRNNSFLKTATASLGSTTDVTGVAGTTYQYKVRFYVAMGGYNNTGAFSPQKRFLLILRIFLLRMINVTALS